MEGLSDRELWSSATAGDAECFGLLFERHARAVYNLCFRRVGSWAVAEDLTSEVFFVAWRRRRSVEFTPETESVLPWLLGVATNLIRNRDRSDRRAARAVARLDAAAFETDFSDDVDGRLADERRMREVLRVVQRLSRSEREVLALCVWADLSYDDCALALGLPVGTVRSRLSRARSHLRELLGQSGDGSARGHQTMECQA